MRVRFGPISGASPTRAGTARPQRFRRGHDPQILGRLRPMSGREIRQLRGNRRVRWMRNRRRGGCGLRRCQSPARREQQRSADVLQNTPHSIFPCLAAPQAPKSQHLPGLSVSPCISAAIETHPVTNRYICFEQYRSPAAPSKCCAPVKHIQDGQWLPSITKDAVGLRSGKRGGFRRSLPPLRRGHRRSPV
jgi:hypothetical protein